HDQRTGPIAVRLRPRFVCKPVLPASPGVRTDRPPYDLCGGMIPALVLTAGAATRLRPLSYVRAKAALPVAGKPLVRRILRQLAAAGVRDAVLNLHHLAHTITSVVGDGADLGMRVRYSWESPGVLGTAGGPRHALPLIDAPTFLVVNGDTLTDAAIGPMLS